MPSKNHAIVQKNLIVFLEVNYGNQYSILSEINTQITSKERVPDIGIFSFVEFTPGEDEVRMTVMPLGVIEILSPTQDLASLISESAEYFNAGVKSYWLVIPDLRTIYVFNAPGEYQAFTQNDERLVDETLNIELEMKTIFK
jgi:Uma2 family endonuclease